MNQPLSNEFMGTWESIVAFFPKLIGGLALILAGWILGWVVKRVILQLAIILKLERFLTSFRWGKDFSKADIRYGLYGFLGNIGFLIVFLIFLESAFDFWGLKVIKELLESGIYFLPKLVVSLIIFGIGWLIASAVSKTIWRTLRRENVAQASLISRFINAVLLLFFSAMALVNLNIAREIVIIGFATIFIAMAVIAIILVALRGKEVIPKVEQPQEEE